MYYIPIEMQLIEKRYHDAPAPTAAQTSAAVLSKLTSAHDYVLKSYRLEENRHFNPTHADEIPYHTALTSNSQQHQQPEHSDHVDEDIVLVALELTPSKTQAQQDPAQQQQGQHMADLVYVFDDDEIQPQPATQYLSVVQQNESAVHQNQSVMHQNEQNNLNIKMSVSNSTLYISERGNVSPGELAEPQLKRSPHLFSAQGASKQQESEQEAMQSAQTVSAQTGRCARSLQAGSGISCLKGVQILGKRQQQQSDKQVVSINIVDKPLFSMSRLPSGVVLRCIIKRSSSFLNLLSPEYDLYLANGLKHIVSAKKFPMRNRELFKFSTDPYNYADSNILGVMHTNPNHNIYWLLDLPKYVQWLNVSFLHLIVGYHRLKKHAHRKFTVLLPEHTNQYHLAIDYQQAYLNFADYKQEIDTQIDNLLHWDGQSAASSKNFVLADEDEPEYRFLELQKQSENVFEVSVQHPLSPLQAMAIAMTRFDAQLY